jgi:alpha-1,2-mannosyltransferase
MPDAARSGGRWRYEGVGWPRSLEELRLYPAAAVIMVAATIWGYACIGPNGRLLPGHTELHRTDFTVFTEAGAAFFDGRDPYKVTSPRGWYYLYPPLFALLVAPLSLFDTESQVVVWFVLNVALTFGCFAECRKLWRLVSVAEERRFRMVAAVCAALAVVLPFLDCMQAGQLGIAILYLLLVGFRLALQSRWWPHSFCGGLILALPACVKLVPALPVLFLLFQRWSRVLLRSQGRRPWGQTFALSTGVLCGSILFVLAIPASLVGWHKNIDYLRLWHARIVANDRVGPDANFNIHSFRNQSLANAVYLWNRTTGAARAHGAQSPTPRDRPERVVHSGVRAAIGVILAALLGVGLSLSRRENDLDRATAFGLACGVTLLVSPLSWGHYYMVQFPALLCVPIWLRRRGLRRLATLAAVFPPVLSWFYYLGVEYTGSTGLLGLGTTVWFLGALGTIVSVEVLGALSGSSKTGKHEPATLSPRRPHALERRRRGTRSLGAIRHPSSRRTHPKD